MMIHDRPYTTSLQSTFLCNAFVMYYVNVFIHSLLYFFAVLVILKVQVHLYRPNSYWLCVVCVNFGSSWLIDRLLLQVHGFGTVFIWNYVLWTAILAFQNSK